MFAISAADRICLRQFVGKVGGKSWPCDFKNIELSLCDEEDTSVASQGYLPHPW